MLGDGAGNSDKQVLRAILCLQVSQLPCYPRFSAEGQTGHPRASCEPPDEPLRVLHGEEPQGGSFWLPTRQHPGRCCPLQHPGGCHPALGFAFLFSPFPGAPRGSDQLSWGAGTPMGWGEPLQGFLSPLLGSWGLAVRVNGILSCSCCCIPAVPGGGGTLGIQLCQEGFVMLGVLLCQGALACQGSHCVGGVGILGFPLCWGVLECQGCCCARVSVCWGPAVPGGSWGCHAELGVRVGKGITQLALLWLCHRSVATARTSPRWSTASSSR